MEANFKPDILIVDDVANNLFTLRTLLESNFDATILEASSGEQVLRIINENPVDLILMDVMMPGMDGFETARLIKNRPKTNHIPIIFISAYDPTQKLLEKGIAAGGFDYLTKPIDDNQLVYRLKMYLRFIRHEYMMNLHLRDLNQKLIEEIEERKRTELTLKISQQELTAANAAKDKFFSIIAHDLKSPFNAIIGLSRILHEDYDDFTRDEHLEFIESVKVSAENTLKLLENLLEWSQAQTGKILFEPRELFMHPICAEVVELVMPSARAKQISLTMTVPERTKVIADRNMVSTILRNLLLNAIKFTHIGGRISLFTRETREMAEISISDSGVGIPPEKMEQLFRIDTNLSTYGTLGEEGTGLGLILCKEFVEKNHGQIRVESRLGVGTTFTFMLPKSGN